MAIKYDPSQAEGFEALPAGEYEVYLSGFEKKQSQRGPYPYYNAVLILRDDIDQPGKGRKVWDIFSLSPKAEFKFHNILKAFPDAHDEVFEDGKEILDYAKGKAVRVKLGVRSYTKDDGEVVQSNDVKDYKQSHVGGTFAVGEPTAEESEFSTETNDVSDEQSPF